MIGAVSQADRRAGGLGPVIGLHIGRWRNFTEHMTLNSLPLSSSAPPQLSRGFRLRRKGVLPTLSCLALLLTLNQPLRAHEAKTGAIEIEHPWSRAIPKGAKTAAGYFKVVNVGSTPDRLVAATAEIAGRTEIHEMGVTGDGVMTMRPLPNGLEIPADSEVELKPSVVHLMFKDLKRPPEQGNPFKGTLTFEKAGTVEVEFAVEPVGGTPEEHGAMGSGG